MRKRSALNTGIAVLVGIALLVGMLGTPAPAAAVSPGEVADAIGEAGKDICRVVTFGVCWIVFPEELSVRPAPPQPIRCATERLVGPPMFLTKPIMTAKYQFHGSCSRADMPNAPALNYRLEGSWTPGETNPNKPNASEAIEITGYEPYLPDQRPPGGRIFMYWTARCDREPWLSPEGGNCRNLRVYFPDDLHGKVTDLQPVAVWGSPSFPRSRNAIPAGDRQQLYARYLQLTSPVMQQAPLPSSSVTQPSPIQQQAPLPPSSVMQAPPPSSSAPAQMNRSPFMIRPRGVEEKESGSQTPESSEPAKKP